MEEQIKLTYGNEEDGAVDTLNKLGTTQKILELLETQEVVSVEVIYKKERAGSRVPTILNETKRRGVREMEKQVNKLKNLSKPLIAYLRKNYNPHTSIIITSDCIRVVNDLVGIPIELEND